MGSLVNGKYSSLYYLVIYLHYVKKTTNGVSF